MGRVTRRLHVRPAQQAGWATAQLASRAREAHPCHWRWGVCPPPGRQSGCRQACPPLPRCPPSRRLHRRRNGRPPLHSTAGRAPSRRRHHRRLLSAQTRPGVQTARVVCQKGRSRRSCPTEGEGWRRSSQACRETGKPASLQPWWTMRLRDPPVCRGRGQRAECLPTSSPASPCSCTSSLSNGCAHGAATTVARGRTASPQCRGAAGSRVPPPA